VGTALNTGHALYSALTAAGSVVLGELEGLGATTADSSGNANTLTINASGSGLTWGTDGAGDACLNCAGASLTVAGSLATPIVLDGTGSYTIWVKCKQTANDNNGMICGNENNGGVTAFLAILSGVLRLRTVTGGTTVDYDFTLPANGSTADHIYQVNYDQPGAKVHAYQDGTEIGTGQAVASNRGAITIRSVWSGYQGNGTLSFVGRGSLFYLAKGYSGSGSDATSINSAPYGVFGTPAAGVSNPPFHRSRRLFRRFGSVLVPAGLIFQQGGELYRGASVTLVA
jgi:hypothetical protein